MNKQEIKNLWKGILIIGIFLVIFSFFLINKEISSAINGCDLLEGNYSLKTYPLPIEHLCNDKLILHYEYGWNFDSNISYRG